MNEMQKNDRIKKLIQDFHLLEEYHSDVNQSALADYCGVSKKTVSRWFTAVEMCENPAISDGNLEAFERYIAESIRELPEPTLFDDGCCENEENSDEEYFYDEERNRFRFVFPSQEDEKDDFIEEADIIEESLEERILMPECGFCASRFTPYDDLGDKLNIISEIQKDCDTAFQYFYTLTDEVRNHFLNHRHILSDVGEADRLIIKKYRNASQKRKEYLLEKLKEYTFPMNLLLDKTWNTEMRECMELIHLKAPTFETQEEKSGRNLNRNVSPQKKNPSASEMTKTTELIVPLVLVNQDGRLIYTKDEFLKFFQKWMEEVISFTREEWYIIYNLKAIMTTRRYETDILALYSVLEIDID